jgi:hypothetical protein
MPWLILLALLIVPFILASQSRHPVGRIGLLLFWLALEVYVGFLVREGLRIQKDLETPHSYALAGTPGAQRIEIAALSQGSMKGVLRGGNGVLPRAELEKFHWKFRDAVLATWFEAPQHEELDPGDTFLFRAQWSGPTTLEYEVDAAAARVLAGRQLLVSHDRSAEHMLRDHALTPINVGAWALGLWGGLWMVVQGVQECTRRRAPKPGS